jgi:hypothetical protein
VTAWLTDAVLFACGAYLCLRLIAAAYRFIDLWYTIRTAYPTVVRGILAWGGVVAALAALLDGRRRTAFLVGMLAFLLFYLSLYALRHLVIRRPAPLDLDAPKEG